MSRSHMSIPFIKSEEDRYFELVKDVENVRRQREEHKVNQIRLMEEELLKPARGTYLEAASKVNELQRNIAALRREWTEADALDQQKEWEDWPQRKRVCLEKKPLVKEDEEKVHDRTGNAFKKWKTCKEIHEFREERMRAVAIRESWSGLYRKQRFPDFEEWVVQVDNLDMLACLIPTVASIRSNYDNDLSIDTEWHEKHKSLW